MSRTPELSSCFFQNLFENKLPEGFQPVLQVLESRFLAGPQQSVRVRLSDGIFSYSGCGVITNQTDRFRDDGLLGANAIIRVLNYSVTSRGPRPAFTIIEYEVISLDYPPIGNPTSHSANPNDFKDIQNIVRPVKRESDAIHDGDLLPPHKRAPNDVSNKGITSNGNGSTTTNTFNRNVSNTSASRLELTQISFITPYINKWRILGVVSNKENIKDIRSPKGQFRIFSFLITDQQSNTIKINAFGEQADKFHPIITDGKAYYISGSGSGSVRSANKSYNTTGHDYELYLQRDSEVNLCTDQHIEQPKFKLNLVPLNRIREHIGECVDILAVIDRVNEISQVTTRADGRQLNKRDIFLVDKSGVEISFTLWGEKVSDITPDNVGVVIGIKGATIKEFNGGVSLSSASGTVIKNNPEGPITNELYSWYTQDRPNAEIKSLSIALESMSFERDLRLIGIAVQHGIGKDSDKGAYFNITALVTAVKSETAIYQGCVTENCRKKVVAQNNQYRCEKCNTTSDTFKNCLMLSIEMADISGTAWATIFEEKALPFLGLKADELAQLQKEDSIAYEAVFDKIRFHMFNFRVRVKYEMYNDQQQMRWNVFDIRPVPIERCKALYLEIIEKNKSENF